MKPKKTIDQLAKISAKYRARLERASAKPATASGIKGRSLAPPPVVEVVEEEESAENECTS